MLHPLHSILPCSPVKSWEVLGPTPLPTALPAMDQPHAPLSCILALWMEQGLDPGASWQPREGERDSSRLGLGRARGPGEAGGEQGRKHRFTGAAGAVKAEQELNDSGFWLPHT